MKETLSRRAAERESGIAEADLAPTQTWHPKLLGKEWDAAK